jgi:glycine/D-amino acid oxidase-like deaminating enzyme
MSGSKRIVICGGGAIGAAVAYFLARRGTAPVVIERHEVAGSASGKSGGFLARDWCRGSGLDALARRSFDLHAELAEALGNPWGYRRLETFAGHASANGDARGAGPRPWLSAGVTVTGRIGSPQTTALVEPRAFTRGLMRAARDLGAQLISGAVSGVARDSRGEVHGVMLEDGDVVEADAAVIAMGPWSVLASCWLPLPAVYGFKGHSLIFDTGARVPPEALFLEYQEADGEVLTPELFARADGTTWVCAVSSTASLPVDPAMVSADEGAHQRLEALCRTVSPALADAPIVARQACFRPVTEDGLPMIGAVPGVSGAFVATGHSVWGMLNAPATGEAMADLILDGASRSIDLAPFRIGRLRALDPAHLRGA